MRTGVAVACPECGADVTGGAHYCTSCGAGQPTRPAASPDRVELADPRVTPPLLPAQPSPTGVFIAVVIVVALLIVTVPVLVARAVFFGPDDTVRSYFGALAARDAQAALMQLDNPDAAGNPLLSGASLAGAGYQPPTGFALTKLTVNGADAVATVRYTVGGRRMVDQVRVHRGRARNLFQRWYVRDGLRSLAVRVPPAASFQLGGATLRPGGSAEAEYEAFPGAYVLALPQDQLLIAAPVTVVAGSAEGGALAPAVRDSARAEIDRQVRAYVDRCAGSTSLEPEGCPFAGDSYSFAEPVRWKVLSYPELQAALDENGQVIVSAQTRGTVRITGGSGSYALPTTYSYTVAGTVSEAGGTIAFTPQR
jgi:hypothetical protein